MLYSTLEIPRPCTLVKVEYPMVKLFEISEYQYIMYYKSLGIKRNILRGQKKEEKKKLGMGGESRYGDSGL